jgi:hypothetical protein
MTNTFDDDFVIVKKLIPKQTEDKVLTDFMDAHSTVRIAVTIATEKKVLLFYGLVVMHDV